MAGKLRLALIAHDVDAKPLMRLATVYDIPMALHRATEEIVLFAADTLRRTGAIAPAQNG